MRRSPRFRNEDKDFDWRTLMRLASWASMAAVAGLLTGSAEAMPIPAPYRADPGITLVAGGCGYGWHRNIYGNCVVNGPGWGGVVVAQDLRGRLLWRRRLAWRLLSRRRLLPRRWLLPRRRLARRRLPRRSARWHGGAASTAAALTSTAAALTSTEAAATGADRRRRAA